MWPYLGFRVEEGEVMWYEECELFLQALKKAFPTGTFLKNGIVQGVKVSSIWSQCRRNV